MRMIADGATVIGDRGRGVVMACSLEAAGGLQGGTTLQDIICTIYPLTTSSSSTIPPDELVLIIPITNGVMNIGVHKDPASCGVFIELAPPADSSSGCAPQVCGLNRK